MFVMRILVYNYVNYFNPPIFSETFSSKRIVFLFSYNKVYVLLKFYCLNDACGICSIFMNYTGKIIIFAKIICCA